MMPRKNLIRTNQFPYHVFIRCNNKEWFELPLNVIWKICIESLKEACKIYPAEIQAFVLMSNHYHLMIWTPNSDLDKFMFEFNRRISHKVRAKTNRINRIFGDRYKWSLISNTHYFFTVEKYILQNPLHAGLVNKCENYPFSTLYYQVRKKPLPIKLFATNEINHEYLSAINEKQEKREDWSKSLLKPTFKPPKVNTSRRLI